MTTIQILINYPWFNGAVLKINTKKRQTVCNGPHWSNDNIHNIWSRLNLPAARKTVWLEFIFVINTSMAPNNVEIMKISMERNIEKPNYLCFARKYPIKPLQMANYWLHSMWIDRIKLSSQFFFDITEKAFVCICAGAPFTRLIFIYE